MSPCTVHDKEKQVKYMHSMQASPKQKPCKLGSFALARRSAEVLLV